MLKLFKKLFKKSKVARRRVARHKPGDRKPRVVPTADEIAAMEIIFETNPDQKCSKIAPAFNVSASTVWRYRKLWREGRKLRASA